MEVYNNKGVFTGALLEAVEGVGIVKLLGEAAVVYLPTCFLEAEKGPRKARSAGGSRQQRLQSGHKFH